MKYRLGKNAYASNPAWYKDGDNKNGESELAGKEFFDTDKDFRPAEFMHFCSWSCESPYHGESPLGQKNIIALTAPACSRSEKAHLTRFTTTPLIRKRHRL